ncbi:cysteine-rich receptor-like protein kinase 10 isoform X2 [Durio zibethinus]|uniref:non-specific serine/threonine protein kinase n=1 Tax=Durio zibethinus TaxID=66656 RepID=A0A6P5WWN9_DURZI|nr:cysteine-rich receptor-like protein kinase 10 isoform X2 [Durio zibethinus]
MKPILPLKKIMTPLYKTKTLLLFFIRIFWLICFITCQSLTSYNHTCLGPENEIANASYISNLTALLDSLPSKASNESFYYDNSNEVFSLFLCRGDVSSSVCQDCVHNATRTLIQRCPSNKTAIIWYDQCMLRYSNINFVGLADLRPTVVVRNNTSRDAGTPGLVSSLVDQALRAENMFAAYEMAAENGAWNRRGLMQCTRDLNVDKCSNCLRELLNQANNCCIGTIGWHILAPSCYITYDMSPSIAYPPRLAPPPTGSKGADPSRPPAPLPENKGSDSEGKSKWIPIGASLSAIFGLTLFCSGGVFLWRRRNFQDHNCKEDRLVELGGRVGDDYSIEIFQDESGVRSQEFPSIQLDILQAATKQFCDEKKLGEGGFGPVYKGKLADGKEIAVKRLSRTSGQGLLEFKNEVLLIARLQHRNLVRLLGCCFEQNEKLLVYEYMPNKSLDVFLFDSSIGVQLDWQKRLSIINGIARGIMYLHEDSRLRIIHRDLKASNVLLDHEMNPKISDFGMARIFGGNQSEANTNRVVGTYGYMAPEYAMEGLFSVKSDVFSFGVLLLEIISGKRNNRFHLWERGESLLTFAWKLWSKGQGMKLIDPLLVKSCVATEVLKCIHIGLLCVQEDPADRPKMSSVIVMLANETIRLPLPAEPAFSVGRVVEEPTQSTSNDKVCSVNEVTISNMLPR